MKPASFRFLLLFFFASVSVYAQTRKVYTTTPVYDSVIAAFAETDKKYSDDTLLTYGKTDAGKPLHLYIISRNKHFFPSQKKDEVFLLINNGIHPGEPDGIDACIELARRFHQSESLPENVIIGIIPVFNVDGCLNRGNYRANQNGPDEHGFRGNAKNLDLNRDFIKCDAQNTISLQQIFRDYDPDVFVDTHVSDGADYQYTMTLIATQRSKFNPVLEKYLSSELTPSLYATMKNKKWEMCPYVETVGRTPETGITEFLETARFSTGYAALRNTIGFVTETHMWKPYNDRVWSTYDFLITLKDQLAKDAKKIMLLRQQAFENDRWMTDYRMNWELDTTQFSMIDFKGYEAKYKTSNISGLPRMYYDHKAPFTKKIPFYHTYNPTETVSVPAYYIIPQGWTDVIERLKLNTQNIRQLSKDTSLHVDVYYIEKTETGKTPYESHFQHWNTEVRSDTQLIQYYKGDYVVDVRASRNVRYVLETLEPQNDDSYFAWNFFDGIMNQKEWFSDYIFEEKAEELLKADPKLKADLESRQKSDPKFAADHWAQLYFIYQRSPLMEKTKNRYPVTRIQHQVKLPLQ